jgi:hypothetical protein
MSRPTLTAHARISRERRGEAELREARAEVERLRARSPSAHKAVDREVRAIVAFVRGIAANLDDMSDPDADFVRDIAVRIDAGEHHEEGR